MARKRYSVVDILTAAVAIYDQSRLDNWPDPPRALHTWTIPRTAGETCPRCGGPMRMIAAITDPDSIRARRALFDLCLLAGLNYRQAQEMARSNRELRASCCY